MTLFNKNNNKDTVVLWKNEAKRLEKERNELYTELEKIKSCKQTYEELIQETKKIKDKYTELINQTSLLADEYKQKLENIIKKEN